MNRESLIDAFNATSGDIATDTIESYETWLENQLIHRVNKYEGKDSFLNYMPKYWQLSDYRISNELSLRDVAKETGISAATISRLERGQESEHGNWIKLIEFYGKHKEALIDI